MGAATAVLHGGAAPVRLTAAKACIGHAEPAAGSVGIIHVCLLDFQLVMRCMFR